MQLATFDAIQEDEDVLVTWQTVSELNNLGFNLYRSPAEAMGRGGEGAMGEGKARPLAEGRK